MVERVPYRYTTFGKWVGVGITDMQCEKAGVFGEDRFYIEWLVVEQDNGFWIGANHFYSILTKDHLMAVRRGWVRGKLKENSFSYQDAIFVSGMTYEQIKQILEKIASMWWV